MLSAVRFNRMINQMGQSVGWRRAYDCPCRDGYSGAARPGCPQCDGKGVIWGSEVLGTAAVAGQKVQQSWAKLGMYEAGDMVLTLPSESYLADQMAVVDVDGIHAARERVRRRVAEALGSDLAAIKTPCEIFTQAAMGVIYEYCESIPRKINKVATACLMATAGQNQRLVDDHLVSVVIVSEFE